MPQYEPASHDAPLEGLTLLGAINARLEDQTAHIAMDSRGIITSWHQDMERLFGWAAQEAVGQFLAELVIPKPLRAAHQEGLQHWQNTGVSQIACKHLSTVACHKDGSSLPVLVDVQVIITPDGMRFLGWVREAPRSE